MKVCRCGDIYAVGFVIVRYNFDATANQITATVLMRVVQLVVTMQMSCTIENTGEDTTACGKTGFLKNNYSVH